MESVRLEPGLGPVADPIVTKEYREDLGEQDDQGYYDDAFRYWAYFFDLDGRNDTAGIYTDTPEKANVMGAGGTRHPQYEDDLRAIGTYLYREAAVSTILTLDRSGAFEPTLEFD